jgi:cell division septation protein DedD
LLGIFFALVLLCGLFFGFGYTLGHGRTTVRHSNPSAATPEAPPASSSSSAITPAGAKPAAQEAAPPPTPAQPNSTQAANTSAPVAATPSTTQPAGAQPQVSNQQSSVAQRPTQQQTAASGFTQQVFQSANHPAPSQAASAQHYMVQVAAVSRPQDANVLVAALQQRGFHATARTEAQDHLMHIQIGPFANLAAADQIRHRLMADGYNAILKR